MHALDSFCGWLQQTAASQAIQTTDWAVPAVQTVHILLVAAVATSALMLDMRLLGIGARDQALAVMWRRYVPFIWWSLPFLLATGAILIVAEPARALQSPVFLLKMILLLAAVVITLICQVPLRKDPSYWESTGARRRTAKLVALTSLPLWIAIIFAGRWIAYLQAS